MSDTTRTIIHSATRFLSGTALSRVTGMLRDIALAAAFGTQSSVAALLVAFRLAHLLRRVFGEGAMQTALIPLFEEIRQKDRLRGGQFFCNLAWSVSALLLVFVVVAMGSLWGLVKMNMLSPGNEEIAWLTFLMMPSLLFICLFGINASLLQCEKSYFIPSAAPVLFNLAWIAGIVWTAHLEPTQAVSQLSMFIVLACLVQWLVTVPRTSEILAEHGVNSLWRFNQIFSPDVRKIAKPLSLAIVGVAATQINSALDAIFARWADPSGPAILWYAIRLQQLPLALIGVALSGALLPPLARAAKTNDHPKFLSFLNFATKSVIAWMVPITAMIFLFGDISVALIYGHGDFSILSGMETTKALWGYGIGLVPMALVLVYAPAYYSLGDYKTPSMASTASMVINGALNFVFVGFCGWGTASIAIATSISAAVNFMWLEKSLQGASLKAGRVIAVTLLATVATVAFQHYVQGIPWDLASRAEVLFSNNTLERATTLAFGIVIFSGIFFGLKGHKT